RPAHRVEALPPAGEADLHLSRVGARSVTVERIELRMSRSERAPEDAAIFTNVAVLPRLEGHASDPVDELDGVGLDHDVARLVRVGPRRSETPGHTVGNTAYADSAEMQRSGLGDDAPRSIDESDLVSTDRCGTIIPSGTFSASAGNFR